jgi:hypothetical protein
MSFIYVPSTAAPSLQIGTPIDVSGVSTVTVTGIPLSSKIVYLNFQNILYSTNDTFFVQLGDSTNIEVTGYVYSRSTVSGLSATAFGNVAATGFGIANGQSDSLWGTVTLTLENSTTNTWNVSAIAGKSTSNFLFTLSGYKSLTNPISQIKVSILSGNLWTSGEINVAYM